jgi:hypothetical protein
MIVGKLRAADKLIPVGVASVDITPDYPVRLNGFGFRRTESEGVTQRIHAKALAFGDDKAGPVVLVTVDNLGLSLEIVGEVAARLHEKIGLNTNRFTATATHTHTAPMLNGVAPTLFGVPIPPEHQQHIDRYTRELIDKLEQVAMAAVKDIRPARLSWGIGSLGFSFNRRTKGGPVDHDFPAMVVRGADGKVRAIYFSYACHCVTMRDNKISGDWAGFAQGTIEKEFPGAIALASVGCGADSNPTPKFGTNQLASAEDQGQQVLIEVKRLVPEMKPLTARPQVRGELVELAFDTPRAREQWEERSHSTNYAIAYHAKVTLEKLDRGESLPAKTKYLVQTWTFGNQLAMIFMPGETVVDYSLRLKREFDRERLWINGYSNEERCYVPSERILKEGGYEGGDAMIYYDRPQRFAPGLEQQLIDVVHRLVPQSFAK